MILPLEEHTLCSSIMDFIQTLPEYGYVCSVEQTNRYLQEEIEQLKSSYNLLYEKEGNLPSSLFTTGQPGPGWNLPP